MTFDKIIIYIMAIFLVIGGMDRIFGNRLKLEHFLTLYNKKIGKAITFPLKFTPLLFLALAYPIS